MCGLAASAAPISMSSMTSCPTRESRSFPAMKSSAASTFSEAGSRGYGWASASAPPWLGHTCGICPYCIEERENLDRPLFTGHTRDGGFATVTIADARFTSPIGEDGSDEALAPLLCAGLIGWRALGIAGDGKKLGLYGFGAAAHILAQIAKWQGRSVFAFTRPGDVMTQAFARSLGTTWAGGSEEMPSELLDAAIIFVTAGDLVPVGLKAARKGGRVVCAGIHMSDIPVSLMICFGKSGSLYRLPTLHGRMDSISCGWRRKSASSPKPRSIRSNRPTRRSPICAPAGPMAQRFSYHEPNSIFGNIGTQYHALRSHHSTAAVI